MAPSDPRSAFNVEAVVEEFVQSGLEHDHVVKQVTDLHQLDRDKISFKKGQLSCWAMAPTALMGDDLLETSTQAASQYLSDSLFYRGLHFSLQHMYESTLRMTQALSGLQEDASGVFTLGGTENNLLAVLGARELARENGKDLSKLNLVMSHTGHPSFVKGAHYFGLEVRRVPINHEYVAPAADFEEFIDENTALIVASAPDYCYGQIDDVEALAKYATNVDAWLHVDAAVGGSFLSMFRELGDDVPPIGFELEGVTSISVDLHKHVYGPIGSGVLFCRSKKHTELHGYDNSDWPMGRMQTSGINGAPPASSLAGSYAMMRRLGLPGYQSLAKQMRDNRNFFIKLISALPDTHVFGNPLGTIIPFGWKDIPATYVATVLKESGWKCNQVKHPAAIHCTIDAFNNDDLIREFAEAVGLAVDKVRKGYVPDHVEEAQYS